MLTSFYSPGNGTTEHVFVTDDKTYTDSGVLCITHYMHTPSSGWQGAYCQGVVNYLTRGPITTSTLLGYYTPNDNNNHLFYVSGDGHIHEWYWPESSSLDGYTGPYHNGTSTISDQDLTAATGAPLPVYGDWVTSTLTGFVDSSGIEHVFYMDASNNVQELYFNGRWWKGGPTGQANALNGQGMTSVWDGISHIYFTGRDGNLWEDYFDGQWWSHPLTGPSGAVTPTVSTTQSPSGFITASLSGGAQAIWGAQSDGPNLRLVALLGRWQSAALNGLPALSTGSPKVSFNGTPYYIGTDQNIYAPNTSNATLQGQYGGPVADPNSRITGFYDNSGYSHLFYMGNDHHLHEYYQSPSSSGWASNDLSYSVQFFNGPPARVNIPFQSIDPNVLHGYEWARGYPGDSKRGKIVDMALNQLWVNGSYATLGTTCDSSAISYYGPTDGDEWCSEFARDMYHWSNVVPNRCYCKIGSYSTICISQVCLYDDAKQVSDFQGIFKQYGGYLNHEDIHPNTAEPGDYVTVPGSNGDAFGHSALIVAVAADASNIWTIDGNTKVNGHSCVGWTKRAYFVNGQLDGNINAIGKVNKLF